MSVMLMAIVCEPLIVELHIVEPSHISQLTTHKSQLLLNYQNPVDASLMYLLESKIFEQTNRMKLSIQRRTFDLISIAYSRCYVSKCLLGNSQ